jgi:hypothetical protein
VEKAVRIDAITPQSITPVLERWLSAYPNLGVLAFLPEAEAHNLATLQALFREAGIPLVGAIFPALIDGDSFEVSGVLLFRLDTMPHYLLQGELHGAGVELEQQVEALAEQLSAAEPTAGDNSTLFLLFDAMLPNIAQILETLYLKLADRVHYMGVNAGSETFQPMPCLFDQQQLVQNGALALLLPHHEGAILEHGYQVPEEIVAATSTEGNRIISIDWRPAFEVYRERIKSQYGVEVTQENFYQYSVHFPFGIIRADNEVLVRIPVALEEDGSLFCVGEIPPNAILTLLDAPQADSMRTSELLAAHFPEGNKQNTLLSFYCAGRRLHLGIEAAENELRSLIKGLHNPRIYGALSLGEIGSSRRGGYPLFHNAALIISQV